MLHICKQPRRATKSHEIPRNPTKSHEIPRNPTKSHEIPRNPTKSHEIPRNPTKSHEIPRNPTKSHEIPRNPTKSHEIPRNPTKSHEIPRNPTKSHEIPRNPTKSHEIPRNPTKSHEIPRNPTKSHEIPRNPTKSHEIPRNPTKSKLMMFSCRTFKMKPACNAGASIFGQHVEYVDEYVYLGHVIIQSLNDDNGISRNKRAICVRASMLLRAFCKCTPDVKTIFFNSYCGTVYCAHLWAVYAQYHYTNLIVCYNNAFRRIFGFEKILQCKWYVCKLNSSVICRNSATYHIQIYK